MPNNSIKTMVGTNEHLHRQIVAMAKMLGVIGGEISAARVVQEAQRQQEAVTRVVQEFQQQGEAVARVVQEAQRQREAAARVVQGIQQQRDLLRVAFGPYEDMRRAGYFLRANHHKKG